MFPQAPLRSRTVGFPESGSDLRSTSQAYVFPFLIKLKHGYASARHVMVCLYPSPIGLSLVSSTVPGRVLHTSDVRVPRVPLPVWVLPSQNDLLGHFLETLLSFHRSYGLMRQTTILTVASLFRLARRVFAGCHPSLLEGGPSRHYLRSLCIGDETHTPPCPSGAFAHFFPDDVSLTLRRTSSAHSVYPCNTTSTGWFFSRLQSFVYLSAPMLARPPYCTYRHFRGADGPYTPRIA